MTITDLHDFSCQANSRADTPAGGNVLPLALTAVPSKNKNCGIFGESHTE